MTKTEIIDELARSQQVEKMVYRLLENSRNPFDAPDDLIQDIYLILLEKEEELIQGLYNRQELGYYILTIVKNQLFSQNSPYYTTYIKRSIYEDIEEQNIITEDRE